MKFKTDIQKAQWAAAEKSHRMVVPLAQIADAISLREFDQDVVVTEVFRSDDDHRALMARLGRAYVPTVHSYWRGVDLRSTIYTRAQIDHLVDALNAQFVYGGGRKAAIYHDVGAGAHIHLQAPGEYGAWPAAGGPHGDPGPAALA